MASSGEKLPSNPGSLDADQNDDRDGSGDNESECKRLKKLLEDKERVIDDLSKENSELKRKLHQPKLTKAKRKLEQAEEKPKAKRAKSKVKGTKEKSGNKEGNMDSEACKSKNKTKLCDLNDYVILKICNLLDSKSVLSLSFTCQRFRQIINGHKRFWRRLCQEEDFEAIKSKTGITQELICESRKIYLDNMQARYNFETQNYSGIRLVGNSAPIELDDSNKDDFESTDSIIDCCVSEEYIIVLKKQDSETSSVSVYKLASDKWENIYHKSLTFDPMVLSFWDLMTEVAQNSFSSPMKILDQNVLFVTSNEQATLKVFDIENFLEEVASFSFEDLAEKKFIDSEKHVFLDVAHDYFVVLAELRDKHWSFLTFSSKLNLLARVNLDYGIYTTSFKKKSDVGAFFVNTNLHFVEFSSSGQLVMKRIKFVAEILDVEISVNPVEVYIVLSNGDGLKWSKETNECRKRWSGFSNPMAKLRLDSKRVLIEYPSGGWKQFDKHSAAPLVPFSYFKPYPCSRKPTFRYSFRYSMVKHNVIFAKNRQVMLYNLRYKTETGKLRGPKKIHHFFFVNSWMVLIVGNNDDFDAVEIRMF